MTGTIAITDYGWYEFLESHQPLDEVNFWTPSAHWPFNADIGSPFIFKLKAKYNHAICGFAYFSRFVRLPEWLAWDWFQIKNGCPSLESMKSSIKGIRENINYHATRSQNEIGCILLSQPTFFAKNNWISGPKDWPSPNLRPKKYDLQVGEGHRIWIECKERDVKLLQNKENNTMKEEQRKYGSPQIFQPRLGQGIFRVAVMEAYNRACAITHEHSLPALEASHIKPFALNGPSEINNGILLRADLHRLFDQGYITITPEYKVEISPHLKLDYDNGRTYYPFHGASIYIPNSLDDAPKKDFLVWHNEEIYRAA